MSNIQRIMQGLPVLESELQSCDLNIEQIRQIDNPLSMLIKYPFESQWKNNDVWQWLKYQLAHAQGKQYIETGKRNSFTKQTAHIIASE